MERKIKVLTLGDMPLAPSGVGIQSRNMIEALLKSGKFQVISLGGAIKHKKYNPIKTEEYGDDWVVFPVDNHGTPEVVRSIMRKHRPDVVWFMTDPRFWEWLWAIEHEIRPLTPMLYYHVWDNYPLPKFNKRYYDSNDKIITISKVTSDIVQNVAPGVDEEYLPHAVDTEVFRKLDEEKVTEFTINSMRDMYDDSKMVFFWNNRNARRKQSGTVIWWFKEFLDEVGRDKATLVMHTDPKDVHGPDLEAILEELDLNNGEVMISSAKVDPTRLAYMYNMADCTINIADAEGFGLATFESLACETPIVVTMTGGLQEQVTDGKDWFGVGIQPASKVIIGSQQVPYIYEDRVSKEDFINAMKLMFNATKEEREEMGRKGREHVVKNYGFDKFEKRWVEIFLETYEKYGSWETRKNYKSWSLTEV